jgi:hypothetical protein
MPDEPYPVPNGVLQARIDPATGMRRDDEAGGLFEEILSEEYLPPDSGGDTSSNVVGGEKPAGAADSSPGR